MQSCDRSVEQALGGGGGGGGGLDRYSEAECRRECA